MYSVEYRCTKQETPVTTMSIITAKESNRKPQPQNSNSELNHWQREMVQIELHMATSKNAKTESRNDKKIDKVDRIQQP